MERKHGGALSALLMESLWIFLIASLLHFGYTATRFFPLSFISAVNESVWEHVKIIFFAALFCNLFIYFMRERGNRCFIAGLGPSLFSILLSVPFLYYGYTGILGHGVFIFDLLIAYLSALICQAILNRISRSGRDCGKCATLSIVFIIVMITAFFLFTWYPPKLPVFIPPV